MRRPMDRQLLALAAAGLIGLAALLVWRLGR